MTDQAALPLRGEQVSTASPSFAGHGAWTGAVNPGRGAVSARAGQRAPSIWAPVSLCGAVCLWGAPSLLLYRYAADQLLDALVRPAVQGTDRELLVLCLLLGYLVASGLLVGSATARLAAQLGRSRVALYLTVAPLIVVSLATTMVVAVPLFVGVLIRCFPSLL